MRLDCACCLLAILSLDSLAVCAEDAAARPVVTTGKPASAERVLLLENGKVLSGVIRKTATGYVINVPGGQMVLPFDQVKLDADDIEDAYRQQRGALPEHSATERVELARWCHTNKLPDQARKELRDALRLEPELASAKKMLQRLNDQLLTTKDLPAVTARNGQYSMIGEPKLGVSPDTLGGLPREAATDFVSKVQPLLVNRCATSGCHGPGSGNSFELQRTKVGKATPKSYNERNMTAVLERVDRERPLNSPLLTKLRGELGSSGIRQPHGSLSRDQTQTLRNWIEAISEKPEPIVPVKIESESTENDGPTKSDSPRERLPSKNADEGDDNFYRGLLRDLRSSEPQK